MEAPPPQRSPWAHDTSSCRELGSIRTIKGEEAGQFAYKALSSSPGFSAALSQQRQCPRDFEHRWRDCDAADRQKDLASSQDCGEAGSAGPKAASPAWSHQLPAVWLCPVMCLHGWARKMTSPARPLGHMESWQGWFQSESLVKIRHNQLTSRNPCLCYRHTATSCTLPCTSWSFSSALPTLLTQLPLGPFLSLPISF